MYGGHVTITSQNAKICSLGVANEKSISCSDTEIFVGVYLDNGGTRE